MEWSVTVEGAAASSVKCDINIIDKNGASKVVSDKCSGKTAIAGATLWWPYTHSKEPGELRNKDVPHGVDEATCGFGST